MKRKILGFEDLEGRALLSVAAGVAAAPSAAGGSAPTLTLGLAPASDPMHDGAVFQMRVTVEGQAAPGAVVKVARGAVVDRARADAEGDYALTLRVPRTQVQLTATTTNAAGQEATATLAFSCGDQAIAWNAATLQAIRDARSSPPVASRDLAIVSAAVFGAVNAIDPVSAPYHVTIARSLARGASADAAAAQAAHDALVALFPGQAATFDAALTAALAGTGSRAAQARGIAVGKSAAAQVLAWRSDDGSAQAASTPYTPSTVTGVWRPTPPGDLPALLPGWGNVTPFGIAGATEFPVPGPPALDSPAYAAAVAQVDALGSATSTTRTADQTQIALFWDDAAGSATPPGHWNEIAEGVALRKGGSLVQDARTFALLNVAMADAAIAVWNVKFADNFWRPVTAIRQAGAVPSTASLADPSWTPLLTTPNFPSYVSGHSTFSGAAAAVLSAIYGPNVPFTVGNDTLPGVTRSFTSFDQAAQEAGISRIYGGIHYPFDNTDGLTLGQEIGNDVAQNVLKAPVK